MGFTNGGQIIISHLIGAAEDDLKKAMGTIAVAVFAVAVFVTVISIIFTALLACSAYHRTHIMKR